MNEILLVGHFFRGFFCVCFYKLKNAQVWMQPKAPFTCECSLGPLSHRLSDHVRLSVFRQIWSEALWRGGCKWTCVRLHLPISGLSRSGKRLNWTLYFFKPKQDGLKVAWCNWTLRSIYILPSSIVMGPSNFWVVYWACITGKDCSSDFFIIFFLNIFCQGPKNTTYFLMNESKTASDIFICYKEILFL